MSVSRIGEFVGRVLGDRYRLLSPLGSGASAHVYLAEDVRLRRRVAVKVLHGALADDEAFLRRFRLEAQSAAALNHPHIMRVFDWGDDGGPEMTGPYLVLEYLGGGSLRDMLDRGHRLTPSQALVVGLEAARGLDHAHRRGLVHRDIKPANLLFDEEGRLCVADFGVARALAEAAWTEPTGTVIGTARYASPEQARGAAVDGKSDVYSLALVLVEIVTGQVPFAADTTIATLMARADRPLLAPAALGPLAAAVTAAGTVDPADRLDAAGFIRALDRAARDLDPPEAFPLAGHTPDADVTQVVDRDPTVVGPVTAAAPATAAAIPPVVASARRRRRWPWALVAAVVAALLVVGGLYVKANVLVASHTVPVLEHKLIADARRTADRDHLKLQIVDEQYRDETQVGEVLTQDPRLGTIKENSTIKVVVSKGPAPVDVPDLTGTTLDQATQILATLKLKVGKVDKPFKEDIAAGQVLDWSPKHQQVPAGSAIDLTVSGGPQPRTIGDWSGHPVDEVQRALIAQGLQVKLVNVYSDQYPQPNTVVATSPGKGGTEPKGGTVTVQVSQGPQTVPVPDVSGETVDRATRDLAAVGLQVSNILGPPNRRVFETNPRAGTKVQRGSGVDLIMNTKG